MAECLGAGEDKNRGRGKNGVHLKIVFIAVRKVSIRFRVGSK